MQAAFTPETVVQAGRQADALPWREAQLAAGRVRLPTAVYRDDHVGVLLCRTGVNAVYPAQRLPQRCAL